MSMPKAYGFTWGATAAVLALGSLPAMSTELPIPCAPCNVTGTPPLVWVSSGTATMGGDASHMVITAGTSAQPNVVLNWQSFNVSADGSVQFIQPGATAIALNRIFQNDPSRIYGSLTANGQVYLINQNGILFGNPDGTPMQVNVQSLIASTLPINDSAITNGILAPIVNDQAAFIGTASSGSVQVSSGATLKSADGGRIAIFAPTISNAGHIETPDGQALLAAGQKVYLQSSDDPNLRGLLVEVDQGGAVTNTGSILSQEGNITLMGLAVNQSGRVTATTSVTKAGSISLLARDTVGVQVANGGRHVPEARHTGTVEFGAGSVTEVALDTNNGETAVDDQPQVASAIAVDGKTIHMAGGSAIVAHGGTVAMTAEIDPALAGTAQADAPDVSIQLDAGSSIDVSGGTVDVPMERNAVAVQLRGNELRDDPQQRDGVLRGQTVVIDARVGTPLADVSGYVAAATKRTVTERMGNGGTVSLLSQGKANISGGASINLSGGAVNYLGGDINTTKLVGANGQVYDIGSAPQNVTYVGLYGPAASGANKWGSTPSYASLLGSNYVPGYTQGLSAGTLQVSGRNITLAGDVLAQTQRGLLQTSPSSLPLTGQLIIGLPAGRSVAGFVDYDAPSLWLGDAAPQGSNATAIAVQRLNAQGVGRFALYSDGRITVPAGQALTLLPGTKLALTGPAIDLQSSIIDHGGAVSVLSAEIDPAARLQASQLAVAAGTTFDLSGLWTNDFNSTGNPSVRFVNGGALSLATTAINGTLAIGDGVTMDVSSGASVNVAGTLGGGNGGSIALAASGQDSTLDLGAGLTLRGYAAGSGTGGSLSITAPSVTIADGAASATPADFVLGQAQQVTGSNPLLLASNLFGDGGFARYAVTADQGSLAVLPGSQLRVLVASRTLDEGYLDQASGSPLASLASVGYLPDYQRQSGSIQLAMNLLDVPGLGYTGRLSIGQGATIAVDPKGSIGLSSTGGSLYMDGSLLAQSGSVTLAARQLNKPFDPAFSLWLGSHALVDVSGAVLRSPDGNGNTDLQVLNAGRITATSAGYIVTEQGSLLRDAGSSVKGDLQSVGYVQHLYDRSTGNQQSLGSAGGVVALNAGEGMVLLGSFDGHGGSAAYTAGELDLNVDRGFRTGAVTGGSFPTTPTQVTIGANVATPAAPLVFGNALDTVAFNGQARIATSQLAAGGIDAVNLKATQIQFDNTVPVDLSLARQITLNATQFGASDVRTVHIAAPAVTFQSPSRTATGTPRSGLTSLDVQADNIDLVGGMTFSGFGDLTFASRGDIRLRGAADAGALSTNGGLTLQANRIFPATMTSFTFSAADPDAGQGTINILSNGGVASASDGLLSAGGSITLNAGLINQDGVLEAPLGSISLNARDTLTIGAGSLTSVHASAAQILLGRTINLADWYYSAGGSSGLTSADQLFGASHQSFPGKSISLNAKNLDVAKGATVDYSGGGDAVAWEQIPGPGGSSDALSIANAGGMFAILPASSGYGPVDPAEYAQWGLTPGAAVTLYQPANGLAAGTYAILPPRYALLPGAFLVKPVSGYANMDPTQSVSLTDGSTIVAGTNTFLNTGLQTGAVTGFDVYKGSYAYQLAEYHLTSANSYLPGRAAQLGLATPPLPVDAGRLSLSGQGGLVLDGAFTGAAGTGGKASQVDVSATNLAVVSALDPALQATQVTAANLQALGAGSLLLGGARSTGTTGTNVTVQASTVAIGDGVSMSLPELLLVGRDSVTIGTGAQLTASGTNTSTGNTYIVSGDSARVLLSNARGAQVQATYAPGALTGQRGVVTANAGSTLGTTGSLVLDGARDLVLGGQISASAGSTVSLASSAVTLGDGAAAGTGGLVLTSADIANLQNLDLSLKGRTGITIVSPVSVSANNLVLDAPVLSGKLAGAGDTAGFAASQGLVLRNSSGSKVAPGAAAEQGTLSLSGKNVTLDGGAISIAGFANTQLSASGLLLGKGNASLGYRGNLLASAPLLTLADGANLAITAADAAGAFRLTAPAGSAPATSTGIGGALNVTAGTIAQDGNILLHSGSVVLNGANGVTLGTGSTTSVAGFDVAMPGLATPVAAGRIALQSSAGDLVVQSGATVDVSGSAGGGDAGTLSFASTSGHVGIDAAATLKGGTSKAGANSGSLLLDADSLASGTFSSLNAQLNAAGFNGQRDFRFSGVLPSVDIDAGTGLNVQGFRLVVEQGGINIASHVNVANANGKATLGLFARDTVHVAATGALNATSQAKGTTEAEIDLYSTAGGITVDAGASLSANAPNSTLSTGGGLVHYRLTRDQVANGGFNVAAGTASAGTRQLVEGYQDYLLDDGLIDTEVLASVGNPVYQDATTFMNSAAVAGLKASGFTVTPGVQLSSTGDMLLTSAWDLSRWRFGGEPGVLTIRSGGSLDFTQSLSDGFADTTPSAALRSDRSWSYNLVAGANLASANPLATSAAAPSAVLSVEPDVLVRTGTGDINVASAGDVALLGSVTLDDPYGQGVIYTAGRSAGLQLDKLTNGANAAKYVPVDGGSLSISAGQDIIGSPSDSEFTQFFVEWYRRQPKQARESAGMWINYDAFQQDFAAFGGGDLSLSAGRDLVRVAASVPTTAYVDTTGATQYVGSGSLNARAGRDIASNTYFVGQGTGTIDAGGALTATSSGPYGGASAGTVLAAMDSHYVVHARGDLMLSAIINPTSIGQVNQPDAELDYFLSYSPGASIALTSATGKVTLQNNGTVPVGFDVTGQIPTFADKYNAVYPGSFSALALRGDLEIQDSMYLAPSASGNLRLAAWGNLANKGAEVAISDLDPATLPTLAKPQSVAPAYLEAIYSGLSGTSAHAVPSPHAGDASIAQLIAATGDLTGGFWFVNRPGLVFAGRDLKDLRYNGENFAATDVTRIVAGRDIRFGSNSVYGINLAGPGNLQVVAGRNIDLGPSFGIVTEGNLVNPGLADGGANITVMAGVANDIDSSLGGLPTDPQLADLFLALRTSGRAVANGTALDFQAGFDAVEKLFPKAQATGQAGDLTMVQSRIYTLDGGDINIVVPHGSVNVGVAQAAAGGVTKKASELGIVTEKAGAVRAFVDGDFLVNSSRVFTLGGGDILLWSSNGNIDAGRGAKTTISAPEPTITIDPQGNVQQNFGAAISGSGIRGILAQKGVKPGDVDLYAPRGFVSAGDAGIGSAGNVTIAAVRVIGADNINFGGTAVGVPVDTGGLGASLASVSAASSSASNSATDSAGNGSGEQGKTPLATEALSWLEVFVLGLGEDSCRPDDLDCLKRQKKSLN